MPPSDTLPIDNLTASPTSWDIHMGKGSQQRGIGGSGNVDNATVTAEGNNQMLYQTTGGAWGDTLIGRSIHAGTATGGVAGRLPLRIE